MSKKATKKRLAEWVDALDWNVARLIERVDMLERQAKAREECPREVESSPCEQGGTRVVS